MISGHVLEKNTRNLYTFFSFLFQQKIRPHGRLYGRLCRTRILCSTLIRAALLLVLFPAVPTKTMVHAVALTVFLPFFCKGSVCVEVLTNFYGRFLLEEGHTVPPLRQPFFSFIDAASLWRAESSGSQPVYRKLFPHGSHSSKN